jgi:hypothetical protein
MNKPNSSTSFPLKSVKWSARTSGSHNSYSSSSFTWRWTFANKSFPTSTTNGTSSWSSTIPSMRLFGNLWERIAYSRFTYRSGLCLSFRMWLTPMKLVIWGCSRSCWKRMTSLWPILCQKSCYSIWLRICFRGCMICLCLRKKNTYKFLGCFVSPALESTQPTRSPYIKPSLTRSTSKRDPFYNSNWNWLMIVKF